MLRERSDQGGRDALAAFGLPSQPGLGSVGIKAPTSAPGLPAAPKAPTIPKIQSATPGSPSAPGGTGAGMKLSFNVGMGASTSSDGAGAVAGEPVDEGRRQRSVIDRALQRNDDDYATSSMPLPGDVVSP